MAKPLLSMKDINPQVGDEIFCPLNGTIYVCQSDGSLRSKTSGIKLSPLYHKGEYENSAIFSLTYRAISEPINLEDFV